MLVFKGVKILDLKILLRYFVTRLVGNPPFFNGKCTLENQYTSLMERETHLPNCSGWFNWIIPNLYLGSWLFQKTSIRNLLALGWIRYLSVHHHSLSCCFFSLFTSFYPDPPIIIMVKWKMGCLQYDRFLSFRGPFSTKNPWIMAIPTPLCGVGAPLQMEQTWRTATGNSMLGICRRP